MINFIYGNPGTGKTKSIIDHISKDASNGKYALLIVPEQMTVSMERDILKHLPPSAQLYVEVLNFTRLANKLFRQFGGLTYNYATPAVQKLIMWKAVKVTMPFLSEYKFSNKDDRTLADAMLATYKELSASGISFNSIEKVSSHMQDSVLKNKLRDISTVCSVYATMFGESFTDETDELYRLSKLLEENDCLKGINVYIDSFSSLTGIEHNIMRSIFKQADSCYITIGIPSPTYKGIDTVSLKRFSDTLRKDCASLGLKSSTTLLAHNLRTSDSCLSHISSDLWKLDNEAVELNFNDSIELYRAADIYDESEFAAAKIKQLVISGYSYRDISIIARDIDKYRGIVDQALESYSIPFFLSDKTDLSLSPLSRLILSALNIANYGWKRSDVITHLKTGLCDISAHDADIFEAYTAKWNITGNQFLSDYDWNKNPDGYSTEKTERGEKILTVVNSVKNTYINRLRAYIAELKNSGTYKELCISTLNYLDTLNVKSQLKNISLKYIESERIREAGEFARIYDIFIEALDSVCDAFGADDKPDLTTFSAAIKTILENTEIGSIPTSQDEVTLGSANMMRTDNAKCVILLGACDGEFPANVQSSGLLTDVERDYLINHEIKISGDQELRASDELYYFRRAASAPSEKLIIFTRADSEPSIAFSRIKSNISGAVIKETSDDLLTRLSSYKAISEYYPLYKDTAIGNALAKILTESKDYSNIVSYQKLSAENDMIDPHIISQLVGNKLRLSQSKIEEYNKCKFSYACKYFLKLDDGKRAEFAYNNIGTFIHSILEKFLYTVFIVKKGEYPSETEKNVIIENIIQTYLTELLPDADSKNNARLLYLIAKLKTLSGLIIDDLLEEFSDSNFKPTYFELPIGTKEQPSIEITLKNGTKLSLNGIIDRVDIFKKENDIYVRVVDYKTGNKTFSLSDIAEGKNLQLLLYIFSLTKSQTVKEQSSDNVKPAAITYLSAVPTKVKANNFNDTTSTKQAAMAEIKRSGLIIDDEVILNAVSNSGQNRYLMSSPRKRSTVTENEFYAVFNQVENMLEEIGNEIISGNANASPKAESDSCKYCNYSSICRAARNRK